MTTQHITPNLTAELAKGSTTTNTSRSAGRLVRRLALLVCLSLMSGIAVLGSSAAAQGAGGEPFALVGHGGQCLDVPYQDASNGSNLWMWTCNGTAAQQWTMDNGQLRVMGKCLDIEGPSLKKRAIAQVWTCSDVPQHQWELTNSGEIVSSYSGLCLDVAYGKTDRKAKVWMWTCNGTSAQKWSVPTATNTPTGGDRAVMNLLDEIAEGEGTSDATAKARGYASGYDVPLGYGKFTKNLPSHLRIPISKMTIAQVRELQDIIRPRSGVNSSAVGRYQIVGVTLDGLQDQMNLSNSAIFDADLQDEMGLRLLERRGLKKYRNNTLSASKFQLNLAKEWASIAKDASGYGYYDGQNSRPAATTNAEIDKAIAAL